MMNGELSNGLMTPIGELEWSVRVWNIFDHNEIKTVGQLIENTEAEMMRLKNFGNVCLLEVKQELAKFGLSLGTKRVREDMTNEEIIPNLVKMAETMPATNEGRVLCLVLCEIAQQLTYLVAETREVSRQVARMVDGLTAAS